MKRLGIVAALLAIVFALPSPALAQVKGVYWTTSGFFGPFDLKEVLIPSIPKEKSREVGVFVVKDFDGDARDFNYLELDGDYDMFGDGSVMVLSTPGHTLGHQSMKVRLASGQTIIMSQDAIWMKENLDGYPAGLNYSVKDYNNSINRLKMMRDLENAELFFAHDQDQSTAKGGRWYK